MRGLKRWLLLQQLIMHYNRSVDGTFNGIGAAVLSIQYIGGRRAPGYYDDSIRYANVILIQTLSHKIANVILEPWCTHDETNAQTNGASCFSDASQIDSGNKIREYVWSLYSINGWHANRCHRLNYQTELSS